VWLALGSAIFGSTFMKKGGKTTQKEKSKKREENYRITF